MEELGRCPFCGAPFVKETKDGVTTVYCPSCGFIKEEYEELHGGPQEKSYNLEEYLLRKRTNHPEVRFTKDLDSLDLKIMKVKKTLEDILGRVKNYYFRIRKENMAYIISIIEETVLSKEFLRSFFIQVKGKNSGRILKVLIYKELLRLGATRKDVPILRKIFFGDNSFYSLRVTKYNWPKNVIPYIEEIRIKIKNFGGMMGVVVENFMKFMELEVKKLIKELKEDHIYKGLLETLLRVDIREEILKIARVLDISDKKDLLLFAIFQGIFPFYNVGPSFRSLHNYFRVPGDPLCRIINKVLSNYFGVGRRELLKNIDIYVKSVKDCTGKRTVISVCFGDLPNVHRIILLYSLLKKYKNYEKNFIEYLKETKAITSTLGPERKFEMVIEKYSSLKGCSKYPLPL